MRPKSTKGHRAWALRFLTGRYQGGTVPLEAGRELTIGRLPGGPLQMQFPVPGGAVRSEPASTPGPVWY